MQVWDGKSATRRDAFHEKSCDHADFVAIFYNIKALQEYVTNLANNMHNMPNLVDEILVVDAKIKELNAALAKAPDLEPRIATLEEKYIAAGLLASQIADVGGRLESLQGQITDLRNQYEKFDASVKLEMRRVEAEYKRQIAQIEMKHNQKIEDLNARLRALEKIV